jgi:RHS repeat-associated protein
MRTVLLAFLLAAAPALLADEPPQAVKALAHLIPKPHRGPVSWTAGPYRYDGTGNVAAIGSESFVYDKIGRLKSATVRGPDLTSLQTQTFLYDAYGNLTATAKLGQTMDLTVQASTNRLSSVSYDASGNVIASGAQHYDYDAMGMLNTVRIGTSPQPRVIYAYTADDERLFAFDVASNTTHWTLRGFDNKVLRDFKQAGSTWTVERDYIYRDGLLLAALKPSGAAEHYTLDHLGTPRLVTDGAGHKTGLHAYWPFGEEWSPGNSQEGSPLQYTGHERDADLTGLDYMHARYYAATWGRFLSVDPEMNADKITGQPQAWNRYAYVKNNPMNRTDPTGRCFWDVCAGEALVGAAILTTATAYVMAPSAVIPGKTNGQVLVSTAIGGFQALGRAVGSLIPGRQPTSLPPPPAPGTPSRPTTPGTQATTGVNPAAPIQSHVINTSQGPVAIPSDYGSRPADNGKGTVYQAPGATDNADMIRVMDPTTRYPTGYVVIHNSQGQPVTIDGKPGSPPETHLPIEEKPQQ